MKQKTISMAEARKHLAEITQEITVTGVEYVVLKNKKPVLKISNPNSEAGVSEEFLKKLDALTQRRHEDLKKLATN